MGTPKKAFTKATIGGMETTLGTAVARTDRIALTDFSYLQVKPNKTAKDIITGRNTTAGFDIDSIDCSAELATNLAANRSTAMLLHSLAGVRMPAVQVGCGILVTYTGSEASCRISATTSAISAAVGDLGDESADAAFGSAGSITLSGMTADDLVDAVNACEGYEASLLYGDPATPSATAVDVTGTQAKGRQAVLHFTSTTSGVYLHVFRPNFTASEHPTVSIQMDGVGENQLGSGAVVDTATFSGDLKARLKATWSLMLTKVAGGQTASSTTLTEADKDGMKFSEGLTFIGGKRFCYTKNASVTVANNHSTDEGYCQGSLERHHHVRGEFSVTGSLTLVVQDATENPGSETERAKILSNAVSSLLLVNSGRTLAEGTKALVLIDLPTIQYTEGGKSAGDQQLEQSLSFTAIDTESYDDLLRIHLLSADAS
jgi:hypothetical protein